MKQDHSSIEAELRSLQAAMLDDELLRRLEAAAEGTQTQLTREELRFEDSLRRHSPARLSLDFLTRLEAVVHEVPFPVNEKIVMFPKAQQGKQTPAARTNRPMWSAAAAVALVGAISALMIPTGKTPERTARQADPAPLSQDGPANLIPASFNRGVSEVSDEGIVWKSNNQPHSVVRVVYQDRITLKDGDGRTYQVEQPKVKYMLVPAKTD
ncbi:hypothetical protein JIN84_19220 [Luteolibacter yonseiensis]|uniref:Uncharacterized protein n=1 Tax=Luteolibacter yonseiensis TaxID=1144680 RepID=A0A934RA05_9BACT|nr:hypothetical protein [Luteolibacter yonseiensis]MBK1817759.1 hypothetical protein [Luteolibacter yonseiensis]